LGRKGYQEKEKGSRQDERLGAYAIQIAQAFKCVVQDCDK